MNLSSFYRVSAASVALMVVVALWGLAQVGLDASVPIHWGPDGVANGYAPAWIGFLLVPVITALVIGSIAVVPRIEPRRENLLRSDAAYRTTGIAVVLLMVVVHVGVVLAGVTGDFPMAAVLGLGVGLLLAVIGNVMTTVRPNFLFGVRTPWTLTSDLAWDRTHRLVGRLFVATGLVMVLLSATGQPIIVLGFMLVALVGTVALGFWYSYRVWRIDPDRRSSVRSAS